MFFQTPTATNPPQIVQSIGVVVPVAIQTRVDALLKAQNWIGLADYMETLEPRTRGHLLDTWMRALNKSRRYDRLLEVCIAAIPQLEGAKGPCLSTARLFKAQALSGLGRHREAMEAHLENGRLGFQDGYVSA